MNPSDIPTHSFRFNCPSAALSRSDRIADLSGQIAAWIHSKPFSDLLAAWDSRIPPGLSLKGELEWLGDFAEIWNYRKRQAGGGERWNIHNDEKLDSLEPLVLDLAGQLGLTDISEPSANPDYILILGGARRSNLVRPQLAAAVASTYRVPFTGVVGLTTDRPLDPAELTSISDYAPGARTEYDCLRSGMARAFGIAPTDKPEHGTERPACLSIPGPDPARRANSCDTYLYFLEKYAPQPGSRLLLVTSCIYVPFQLMRFMPLAIEHGLEADCIGVPAAKQPGTVFSAANYLQEIKAALNAMEQLGQRYL